MAQKIPSLHFYAIGCSFSSPTRRAVSYTPSAAMTLRHFSFVAKRMMNYEYDFGAPTLDEISTIEWEIRADAGAGNKPGTATALASGEFDWRYSSSWKLNRVVKYTINLQTGLELAKDTRYWFVLKIPSDDTDVKYPIAWANTYETGAASEVDSAVYSSEYTQAGAWTTGTNTYNLTLYILDDQAGQDWHVVIDGNGYMQPDKMRGYRCEQAASGLAQSRGGQSEWSQLRYPYTSLSQDNWTSGGGQLEPEDPAAYDYSVSLDTTKPNQMIIGPLVHLTGIEGTGPYNDPTTLYRRTLPDVEYSNSTDGAATYVAQKFTAPAGGITATSVAIRCARTAWQRVYALSVALYSDNAGSPGTIMGSWVTLSPTFKWAWRYATVSQALSAGTAYWVVVKTSQVYGFEPEYYLAYDQDGSYAGGAAKYSRNGTTWATVTGASLAFRINYGIAGAMNGTVKKIVYGDVNGTAGLYALAGKEVYKWSEDDGHWDALTAALTADGTDLICFNDDLYVAQGYSYVAKKYDGASWSNLSDNYKYFHVGKGYLWASTAANTVQHSNDGATWSSDITIGQSVYEITAFVNYSGRLLVGKEDGIWEIDDQDLSTEYLTFREYADADNCIGMCVWSGMLFIPVLGTIWRWQGSQYKDVGPTDGQPGMVSEWPHKISRMAAMPEFLLGSCDAASAASWGGVLFYNGMGWHHVLTSEQTGWDSDAIAVTSEVGSEVRVWWGEGTRVTYASFPESGINRYEWGDADFHLNGGSIKTSWWDGGLKDALKFWNRLTLIAEIPTSTFIAVYYGVDGNDTNTPTELTYLGELREENRQDNGEFVLMFPDGLVAKSIQLHFVLNTNDSTVTPRIRAYNVECIVRQPPAYTYTFRVLLANNITKMDRSTEEDRDANDMWEELQRAAAKDETVIVSFPYKSVRGMISYLREETYQYKPVGTTDEEIWERVAVVSLIEAT